MKGTILILLLPVLALSQTTTISFALDTIRRDSFFLVETLSTMRDSSPRPEVTTTAQLFKATAQVDLYVSNLEKDAKQAMEQAEKYYNAAKLFNLKAQLISELKGKCNWWAGDSITSLQPIPSIPETKPIKKKTAPKKQ